MSQQKFCLTVLLWAWLAMEAKACGMCEEAGQHSFTCLNPGDNQMNFSVEVSPKEEIRLQCLDFVDADYSLMDGCEFASVTHAEFHGCSLPNVSYKEVLQKIGVNPEIITTLVLSNVSKKGVLTQQHLVGLDNLQVLHVTGIHSVTNDAFRGTPKLVSIEISNSTISQLDADLLQNMTDLHIIMLKNNKLEELPTELFSGAPRLHTIDLHNNHISTLQKGLFSGLESLETLNISKNNLEKWISGLFSDKPAVEFLDLRENLLSEIEPDAFAKMMKLKMLNLNHNRLSDLPPFVFQDCINLEKLEMNNNFLSYSGISNAFFTEYRSSLVYIDLGYNNITMTTHIGFALNHHSKLQHVILNNNNISVIPDTVNYAYVNLKTLDLSRNSFENLEFSSLIFQSNLVELNLKYNGIKSIDFGSAFPLNPKKTVNLALEGNPLLCDCNNYGIIRLLQGKPFVNVNDTLEIIAEDIDVTFCHSPSGELEDLSEVQTELLTCSIPPLPSDNNCSSVVRTHDRMVLIDCSYQNLQSVQSFNFSRFSRASLTLILANNSLTNLEGLQNYTNILNLTVPYNNLSCLNISHLPPNLMALDVRGNNLTTLPETVLHHLNATDMSLKLGDNPWHCNCDLMDLYRFLHVPSRKVNDFGALQCQEAGRLLKELSEHDLCPFFMQPMVLVTIVAILIFLILFAVLGTVSFYKYKQGIKVWLYAHHMCLWAITEDELDADKKYDAFISYSHKDEEFVTKELVPGLEGGEPKYRVCLHYRDWVPGEYIQNQIMQSVEASRRTIIVLSSNFIESNWGQLEFRAAHSQALQDRTNRLIIIIYGKIPSEKELDEKLKLYISTKTYVRWGDNKFWEKLRYIMPHPPDLVQKKRNKITNKLELCKSTPKQSVC